MRMHSSAQCRSWSVHNLHSHAAARTNRTSARLKYDTARPAVDSIGHVLPADWPRRCIRVRAGQGQGQEDQEGKSHSGSWRSARASHGLGAGRAAGGDLGGARGGKDAAHSCWEVCRHPVCLYAQLLYACSPESGSLPVPHGADMVCFELSTCSPTWVFLSLKEVQV